MQQNENIATYFRFLNEKLDEVRSALERFVQTITLHDLTAKVKSTQDLLARVENLKNALSGKDRPEWLLILEQALAGYQRTANQPDAGLHAMTRVMQIYSRIQSQKWDFLDTSIDATVDFNAIFEAAYTRSRIPKLFDMLIEQLRWVIDSGQIDSNRAINQLQKLLATLKKNYKGDIFSRQGAWQLVKVFSKNFAWAVVEDIPGLKHASKAMRETIKELDIEFGKIQEEVVSRLATAVEPSLPAPPAKEFPALPAPVEGKIVSDADAQRNS